MPKLKNSNPIIIVSGEPYSVFNEIFFKSLKNKYVQKINKPIILIGSKNLLLKQMNRLGFKFKLNCLSYTNLSNEKINKKAINLININYKFQKTFGPLSNSSTGYIKNCFNAALSIEKKIKIAGLINGPISKSHFKIKNLIGITEYLANLNNKRSKEVMLIYNKYLSVSPLTTHISLKEINKKISKKKIINNIKIINNFYKNKLKRSIKFGVTGLNPHCETKKFPNEEEKIIKPDIKLLKKKRNQCRWSIISR